MVKWPPACKHPSWNVRVYRDYNLHPERREKYYYVGCRCGDVLLDGKWQKPSNELLQARVK